MEDKAKKKKKKVKLVIEMLLDQIESRYITQTILIIVVEMSDELSLATSQRKSASCWLKTRFPWSLLQQPIKAMPCR